MFFAHVSLLLWKGQHATEQFASQQNMSSILTATKIVIFIVDDKVTDKFLDDLQWSSVTFGSWRTFQYQENKMLRK